MIAVALSIALIAQVPSDGAISGRVVDAANGRPVTSAIVTLGGANVARVPAPNPEQRKPGPPRILTGGTGIVIDGDDVTNVGIQLVPTFTISGRIVFEGTTPAPAFPAMPLPASIFASTPTGVAPPAMQLLDGGKFSISGLTPGAYRPNTIGGPPRGLQTPIGPWWLKSIAVDGRELLDAPLELRQGSENGLVTFSDQASEVTGSVKDGSGTPVARGFVVIFSADRAHWFVNSRRVVAVAPDAHGRYSIRNLPPGDYRAAVALDLVLR